MVKVGELGYMVAWARATRKRPGGPGGGAGLWEKRRRERMVGWLEKKKEKDFPFMSYHPRNLRWNSKEI